MEEGGTQYTAKVEKVKAANSSSYWVQYLTIKKRGAKSRKKAHWVDLELPASEKAMSWWRLHGYETAEEVADESEEEEEEDPGGGEQMDVEEDEA